MIKLFLWLLHQLVLDDIFGQAIQINSIFIPQRLRTFAHD